MQEDPKAGVYRVHTPLVAQAHQHGGRTEFMAIPRGSLMLVSGRPGIQEPRRCRVRREKAGRVSP